MFSSIYQGIRLIRVRNNRVRLYLIKKNNINLITSMGFFPRITADPFWFEQSDRKRILKNVSRYKQNVL